MKEEKGVSRRGFLKTAAAIGAALSINPVLDKVHAAEAVLSGKDSTKLKSGSMQYRTLGSGNAAMKVSALGFGVMGMNYNRSQSPDRKECIRLIHEAVDRGVTLFDTAIILVRLKMNCLPVRLLNRIRGALT